ncbi:MAG TPA: glycosyltransferase family 39 protein [Bryobacteraceae bacterium]|nr:glycosyltransferase family 39 protein [Bryobacteraceae bacterium]
MQSRERAFLFWTTVAALLLVSRLCHSYVLWADEDYHLAAAIQMLHGKMLYRDLWYDKPPLAALLSLVFAARDGWTLRLAGSIVALASCAAAYGVASRIWSRTEGYCAAALLAFFLIFYAPTAVIPFEPDTLMILPHLAAVYFALRQRPFAAGTLAGIAFLLSPKGATVLAACLLFHPAGWLAMIAGFALPNLAVFAWLGAEGALDGYLRQVWAWGILYAGQLGADPQAQHAWQAVSNWLGFHAALVIGAVVGWKREVLGMRWRLLAWAAISFAAAAVGLRFAPRYFDQLLPALVVPAAGGLALLVKGGPIGSRRRLALAAIAVALVIPIVRFGPRYFTLAGDSLMDVRFTWSDVALDQESRTAAILLRAFRRPGDTVFIWGYRPNLIVYTGLPVASKLWDSQPVTGVPADRHLTDSRPVAPEWARENRLELARTAPSIILDGLSAYNPQLDIHNYPELSSWLAHYCVALRARNITIYRRCPD